MDRRQQSLWLIGGAGAALLLLATALHNVVLQPGQPLRLDLTLRMARGIGGQVEAGPAPTWLPIVAGASVVLLVLGLIFSRSLRRDLLRNLPVYALLLFGMYLLSSNLNQNGGPPPQPAAPEPQQEVPPLGAAPTAPDFVSQPPEWMVVAITALLVLALLGLLYVVLTRLRRRPQPLDRIVHEAREALAELRAGSDLRDTISRCYAEMVRVFAEQRGMGRDRTLTPREFEQRLAAVGVDDRHIQRLTRLFELVRYSPRTPGEREEREAQECLEAIIQAYGGQLEPTARPSAEPGR
jgi:hypothetical protein